MIDEQKKNQFEANQILIRLNPDYRKCYLCNLYFHIRNTENILYYQFAVKGIQITRCFICFAMHPAILRKNKERFKEIYPPYYIFRDYLPVQPKYEPTKL